MAHELRRRNVSSAIEKSILTSLIVSTQFNYEVAHLINFDYFTNSFIRTVARWCIDFFDSYEKAPFNHIQDIFNERKSELKEEDTDLIQILLTDISKKYELDSGLNIDYSIEQALRFFKKRELQITHGNIGILLGKDDIDGAEEQINTYVKVARNTSGWINPFDAENVDSVFKKTNDMFKFPGALGDFLGGFNRGWLVGIAAAFKRGKSFAMQEVAVEAMLQHLKVAVFSLEMYKDSSDERLYKRLMGAESEEGGIAVYPCFDCVKNQDGSCKKKERTNKIRLLVDGNKPKFDIALKYRACTYCRTSNKEEDKKEYSIAWWKEVLNRPPFNKDSVQKYIEVLAKIYKNNYRFKSYPRFSANTSDIARDLDILERGEGFVPDVVIVDYADILKPESVGGSTDVASLDDTWKSLSKMAGERKALIVTASQITRAGIDKKQVKSGDMALWVGKTAHVDLFYTLNQTSDEKEDGIMRIGLIAHRYADFNENANCVILQKLSHGQACLDSEML